MILIWKYKENCNVNYLFHIQQELLPLCWKIKKLCILSSSNYNALKNISEDVTVHLLSLCGPFEQQELLMNIRDLASPSNHHETRQAYSPSCFCYNSLSVLNCLLMSYKRTEWLNIYSQARFDLRKDKHSGEISLLPRPVNVRVMNWRFFLAPQFTRVTLFGTTIVFRGGGVVVS